MKNLRNVFTLLVFSLLSLVSYSQSDLTGEWIMGEKNTVVKIELDNDSYSGTIVSSDNPDVEIGKLILKEITNKKDKWKGKLYAAKKKKWMDAEFTVDKNILKVKVKSGFMSKTLEWIKK